jgi:carbon-monoxide dehydrogenase medium subunit
MKRLFGIRNKTAESSPYLRAPTAAGEGGVFRVPAMERALTKKFVAKSLEGIKIDPANLIADIHGSADYRAHLIGVMARRAVDAALANAK